MILQCGCLQGSDEVIEMMFLMSYCVTLYYIMFYFILFCSFSFGTVEVSCVTLCV